MKTEELTAMSPEQLDLQLKDTIKNLFHLRCQSAAERLETPSEIRKAKRDVARIKTIPRLISSMPRRSWPLVSGQRQRADGGASSTAH